MALKHDQREFKLETSPQVISTTVPGQVPAESPWSLFRCSSPASSFPSAYLLYSQGRGRQAQPQPRLGTEKFSAIRRYNDSESSLASGHAFAQHQLEVCYVPRISSQHPFLKQFETTVRNEVQQQLAEHRQQEEKRTTFRPKLPFCSLLVIFSASHLCASNS